MGCHGQAPPVISLISLVLLLLIFLLLLLLPLLFLHLFHLLVSWGKNIYSKTVLLNMSAACYAGSDRQFGPRVAINCRNFDFTLLFEDAVLILLPSSLFMVLFLARLEILRRNPVKVMSYKLAACKVVG